MTEQATHTDKKIAVLAVRVAAFVVSWIGLLCALTLGVQWVQAARHLPTPHGDVTHSVNEAEMLGASLVALAMRRQGDRKRFLTFSWHGVSDALRNVITGFVLAASVGVLTVLICIPLKWYRFGGWNPHFDALVLLFFTLLVALTEELIFRWFLLAEVERGFGARAAILWSAVVFGLCHLVNKNYPLVEVALVAVPFGMLAGAGYVKSRRLSLPVGMHWGANFAFIALLPGSYGVPACFAHYAGVPTSATVCLLTLVATFTLYGRVFRKDAGQNIYGVRRHPEL